MVQIDSDCQPMNTIIMFFSKIRFAWFMNRIDAEIEHRIFPHLTNEGDYGYPFDSDEELRKFCRDCQLDSLPFVQEIERSIIRMPEAYSEAFRYILYRELKACREMSRARMKMFSMLAYRRIYPETCDPRYIARRA